MSPYHKHLKGIEHFLCIYNTSFYSFYYSFWFNNVVHFLDELSVPKYQKGDFAFNPGESLSYSVHL